MNLPIRDLKVFVPTKDFDASVAFYQELGATLNWRDGGLAEIQLGSSRLYLQKFYAKEWAENFMIYLVVEDADAWHAHAERIAASGRYEGVRVKAPEDMEWGDRVGYVWDPAGVLIHVAQPSVRG